MTEISSPYRHGTPSWIDLMSSDPKAAREFYGAVFGWGFEIGPPESGPYTMCTLRGEPVAGIGPQLPGVPGSPVAWSTYLSVDDADRCAAAIVDAGGSVMMGPMDVFDEGRMAIAKDPTGAVFGVWQPGKHFGARIVNEPGALCWNEVLTPDSRVAGEFYQRVFDYRLEPMEGDFDYTTFQVDGRPVGGMLGLDEGEFPRWGCYLQVADADATAELTGQLGGTVLKDPSPTPFGRMATLRDPQGGTFSVIATTQSSTG